MLVEHGDLAVEHRLLRRDLVADHAQLRILPLAGVPGARDHAHFLVVDEADGANAVPFDFEEPVIAFGRRIGERATSWARWLSGMGARTAPGSEAGSTGARDGVMATSCGVAFFFTRLFRRFARRHVLGDLLLGAAGRARCGVLFHVPAGPRFGVFLLEQQPLVAFAAAFHQHDGELALELLAVQPELEIAARELLAARACRRAVRRCRGPTA